MSICRLTLLNLVFSVSCFALLVGVFVAASGDSLTGRQKVTDSHATHAVKDLAE